MWAARERRFDDLSEVESVAIAEVVPVEEAPAHDPRRGRLGRLALLVAVVGVESAWLGVLCYGAWRLVTHFA